MTAHTHKSDKHETHKHEPAAAKIDPADIINRRDTVPGDKGHKDDGTVAVVTLKDGTEKVVPHADIPTEPATKPE